MEGPLTNYIAYALPRQNIRDVPLRTWVGHLDAGSNTITPLAYASGTPLSNLYEVIEIGSENIIAAGSSIPASSVRILPPLAGRDVLAIGKNYLEHAKEFNASGYDASDRVDTPSHPVVFTKRATSIIAHGEEILPFPDFTSTLDYEGEIGVIIGKTGHSISTADAGEYIWGYTIINDITARERQRDHKQFYIGKSGDTFCPMGPIAVPARHLPAVLKVQTRVNGELRQEATTDDLIFPVSTLIETLSASQTLQLGDVIATGTPAGVGFGLKPPRFLQPGDVVEITATGLGTLQNKVAHKSSVNHVEARLSNASAIPIHNLKNGGRGLTRLNSKLLFVETLGRHNEVPIVFIHGLGGTSAYFYSLIKSLGLDSKYRCILCDLEGHGQSPTKASSIVSIGTYTDDLQALFRAPEFNLSGGATIIAHEMGALVASSFASKHPQLAKGLFLTSLPTPIDASVAHELGAQAQRAREGGMQTVAHSVAAATTTLATRKYNLAAYTLVVQSLLGQDAEGYAKGCTALADREDIYIQLRENKLKCPTRLVIGAHEYAKGYPWEYLVEDFMEDGRYEILESVGAWMGFESVRRLGDLIRQFLGMDDINLS